jgi:hypothetical protein
MWIRSSAIPLIAASLALLPALLLCAAPAAAAARPGDPVTGPRPDTRLADDERCAILDPPRVGTGTSIAAEDEALPFTPGDHITLSERARRRLDAHLAAMADQADEAARADESASPDKAGGVAAKSIDDLGGDDVAVLTGETLGDPDIDIATNGDIYVAVRQYVSGSGYQITVLRSQDGGDTWATWGTLSNPSSSEYYWDPRIHVAEGIANRCFIACVRYSVGNSPSIVVASSDLALATGDFSGEIVVMRETGTTFGAPDLISDYVNFSGYYVYVAAHADDGVTGGDIWFTRSINQGLTFEDAYKIASLTSSDREYVYPDLGYGFRCYIYCTWIFQSRTDAFDSALRFRRAGNCAGFGIDDWDSIQYLTTNSNGIFEAYPQVAGAALDGQVVLVYERLEQSGTGFVLRDPGVFGSTDNGATFPTSSLITGDHFFVYNLEKQESAEQWVLGGTDTCSPCLQRAGSADVTSWSDVQLLGDRIYISQNTYPHHMALDPSRNHRAGFAWLTTHSSDADTLWFDAEWRGDAGYPNLEDGFPMDLAATPQSPPAVVDLDGDGDLEIVFSDQSAKIQVFHHDGTPMTGWPVTLPMSASAGPVAIGDLRGNGELMVIAGTSGGQVHAFETDGTPVPGWPFDTGTQLPAYVSIGALGGHYVRLAAVGSGNRLYCLDFAGNIYGDFYRNWPGRTISAPVAIGDVDGDGLAEVVGAASERVFAVHGSVASSVFYRDLPSAVSDAVTLGDFDLDGDVEVVAPTMNGSLYLLQDDGADFPGSWPFVSSTGSRLSSGAIANCLGGGEPEVAIAAYNWSVHLIWYDGDQQSGFPVESDGWYIPGDPIMGFLTDHYSADIIVGARGQRAWAWDNFGGLIPGWPRWFDDHIYQAPAMGDLDLDGRAEVVFLSLGQMAIFDVNQVMASGSRGWPMYGYDPQRTGCANCSEDITTAVGGPDGSDELAGGQTRISFSAPTPNPLAGGGTTFAFALPGRARVELEVYDIRGRRIATITRQELDPGQHVITWDARDEHGHRLASGQYLARLAVRGPGIDQTLMRKLTVLR